MQYVVDGYNLLFQGAYKSERLSLEEARTMLIHSLDQAAQKLSIHITVVFDAPFQSDDLRRGHFNALEIIFTSKGQSADEYIVEYVHRRKGKEKLVIVTSDKGLARRVKEPNVYVEKVQDFLQKLRKKARPKIEKPVKTAVPIKIAPAPPVKEEGDPKTLPPLSDINAWERIFLRLLKKH